MHLVVVVVVVLLSEAAQVHVVVLAEGADVEAHQRRHSGQQVAQFCPTI